MQIASSCLLIYAKQIQCNSVGCIMKKIISKISADQAIKEAQIRQFVPFKLL